MGEGDGRTDKAEEMEMKGRGKKAREKKGRDGQGRKGQTCNSGPPSLKSWTLPCVLTNMACHVCDARAR